MNGRMAFNEPYRLKQLDAALHGIAARPREELLRAYLPYVAAQVARGVAVKHISRHILGLFHAQPGGRLFRQILSEGAPKPGAGLDLIERAIAATHAQETAA